MRKAIQKISKEVEEDVEIYKNRNEVEADVIGRNLDIFIITFKWIF